MLSLTLREASASTLRQRARDARRGGFGVAKNGIGNLDSRLHMRIVPYLWEGKIDREI